MREAWNNGLVGFSPSSLRSYSEVSAVRGVLGAYCFQSKKPSINLEFVDNSWRSLPVLISNFSYFTVINDCKLAY